VVVVAQSIGAFTAPLVCDRLPADLLVPLAGMIPLPGEPPGDWWANTAPSDRRAERGADGCRHPAPPTSGRSPPVETRAQLHPLVVPQDSQTKQEPAGRMRTPQVEQ
jgi:hypothetical protein